MHEGVPGSRRLLLLELMSATRASKIIFLQHARWLCIAGVTCTMPAVACMLMETAPAEVACFALLTRLGMVVLAVLHRLALIVGRPCLMLQQPPQVLMGVVLPEQQQQVNNVVLHSTT
jgi:hypothetical protein